MVFSRILPLKDFYISIDWPVIVLLGQWSLLERLLKPAEPLQRSPGWMLVYSDIFPAWSMLILIMADHHVAFRIDQQCRYGSIDGPYLVCRLPTAWSFPPILFWWVIAVGASASIPDSRLATNPIPWSWGPGEPLLRINIGKPGRTLEPPYWCWPWGPRSSDSVGNLAAYGIGKRKKGLPAT